jgi:hypothetical protein
MSNDIARKCSCKGLGNNDGKTSLPMVLFITHNLYIHVHTLLRTANLAVKYAGETFIDPIKSHQYIQEFIIDFQDINNERCLFSA